MIALNSRLSNSLAAVMNETEADAEEMHFVGLTRGVNSCSERGEMELSIITSDAKDSANEEAKECKDNNRASTDVNADDDINELEAVLSGCPESLNEQAFEK